MEEWRQIPGVPNYEASNFGRIRSQDRYLTTRAGVTKRIRGRILSPAVHYGTPKQNQGDRLAHGTHQRGQKYSQAKLSEWQVGLIKLLRIAGEQQATIAKRYGISQSQVSNIENGRRWNG